MATFAIAEVDASPLESTPGIERASDDQTAVQLSDERCGQGSNTKWWCRGARCIAESGRLSQTHFFVYISFYLIRYMYQFVSVDLL